MSALLSLLLVVSGVPRRECFPVEELPRPLRVQAEALLLRLMDGEALYTVVGGMKPMSSGWLEVRTDAEKPDLARLEDLRKILQAFRCGDALGAFLQPFRAVYDGKRALSGYVFHRASFARAVAGHAAFFGYFGLTPASSPPETVLVCESDGTPRRNRGYGYLFGYPDYAVDFFVESEERQRTTKEFVKRDFFSVPVFSGSDHRFVWAIPQGAPPRPDDVRIRREAAPILACYTRLRARYVGLGKPGIVALLRDWMDDGTGLCSPETALRKARGTK